MGQVLEADLHSQLNLPRARGEIRAHVFRSGMSENGAVCQKIVRLIELYAVEKIIEFEAHVEFYAVANPQLFVQYRIGILDAGSTKVIAAEISARSKSRSREQGDRRAGLCSRVRACGNGYASIQVRARKQSGVLRIETGEDLVRQAA